MKIPYIGLALIAISSFAMQQSTWGEPHDLSMFANFPWWSWVTFGIGASLYLYCIVIKKEKFSDS